MSNTTESSSSKPENSSTESTSNTWAMNRRDALQVGAAAASGLVAWQGLTPAVHAGENNQPLKIGLVGCGGRGRGAVKDALRADADTVVWSVGDLFDDRVQMAKKLLEKPSGKRWQATPERCFTGFDAYQRVIDSGVDVVLLATPPHFRPEQLAAAVKAGKHVFAEKPVAVDGAGVRSVLDSCKIAKDKNLTVVSGLCWRYHPILREIVDRIQQGALGKITSLQVNYNTGELWSRKREEGWGDQEWQIRNWLYFTWLSGDHNVEQHVHSLDKAAWVMGDQYPVSCWGLGGRQARTDPQFGNIFDHHAVCYEFEGGQRCYSYCRQQSGCNINVSDQIVGTKGTSELLKFSITPFEGERIRKRVPKGTSMYVEEHKAMFNAIRTNKPINNGEYMAKSSLMAIMGRMATYTGQQITWEQALNDETVLKPQKYDLNLSMPVAPVAIPGSQAGRQG